MKRRETESTTPRLLCAKEWDLDPKHRSRSCFSFPSQVVVIGSNRLEWAGMMNFKAGFSDCHVVMLVNSHGVSLNLVLSFQQSPFQPRKNRYPQTKCENTLCKWRRYFDGLGRTAKCLALRVTHQSQGSKSWRKPLRGISPSPASGLWDHSGFLPTVIQGDPP